MDPLSPASDRRLRVLYVNGCNAGGSLISTAQLCEQVVGSDLEITLLHGRRSPVTRYLYRRASNLEVKARRRSANLTPLVRRIGARVHVVDPSPFTRRSAKIVENGALELLAAQPDVVVVSSLERWGWRRLRADVDRLEIPVVLYLREQDLLDHLEAAAPPDLVLANSEALAIEARSRGYETTMIPSAIDLDRSRTETSRRVVLLLNPTEKYGLGVAAEIAQSLPGIPFVWQESSRLGKHELQRAQTLSASLSNVELRRFEPDVARVYEDAKVLLAPYTVALRSNRPRSVLESLNNGIPVLASDLPGLREAAGPGARYVDVNTTASAWSVELERVWTDGDVYEHLANRGRVHAEVAQVASDQAPWEFSDRLRTLVAER